MSETEKQTENIRSQPEIILAPKTDRKKFSIDKKTVLGFVAGFVLAAILFTGVVFGINPELLKGSVYGESPKLYEYLDFYGQSFPVDTLYRSLNDYDKAMNESDRTQIVFITADKTPEFEKLCIELNLLYGNYIQSMIFTGAKDGKNRLRIGSASAHVIAEWSGVEKSVSFADVESYIQNNNTQWTYCDTVTYGSPVYYYMFQNVPGLNAYGVQIGDDYYYNSGWNYVGNIKLLSGSMIPSNYFACDGSAYNNSALESFYGNGSLPTLASPDENTGFYMSSAGDMPSENGAAEVINIGDVSYHAQFSHPYDQYLGEIVLISNMDKSQYGDLYLPCDGRTVNLRNNTALFAILGGRYGVNSSYTTFNLPDFRGKSPLPGADYYIVMRGIFPMPSQT